jgi:formylglycine-generating enzyme required for sulfatase activity
MLVLPFIICLAILLALSSVNGLPKNIDYYSSPFPNPSPNLFSTITTITTSDEEPADMVIIFGKFVKIPAGQFMMGSHHTDGLGKEQPIHLVKISHVFEMGQFEVTQSQWQAIMVNNPSDLKGPDLPVDNVSWDDAQRFIKKLNDRSDKYTYRLPTEAEWEYACKAGSTRDYAEKLDSIAWYKNNSNGRAHSVGQKQPNKWGLYDMYGNVWEWCQDWYGDYPDENVTDPAGAMVGLYRVLRGGSWIRNATDCRSEIRGMDSPSEHIGGVGFRLVRNPR